MNRNLIATDARVIRADNSIAPVMPLCSLMFNN